MDYITVVLIIATVAAVLSTIGMFIFGIVDLRQLGFIKKINKRIDEFESIDPGESFGNWLLTKQKQEDGSEISNLETCARLVGHQIAGSFSMGLKGIASGEARTVRSVENKIISTLQSPEAKALIGFCDQAGIPRDLASLTYEILEKRGLLTSVLKNNGVKGASSSW